MNRNLFLGIVVVIFCFIALFGIIPHQVTELPEAILTDLAGMGISPRLFPRVAIYGMLGLGIALIAAELVKNRRKSPRGVDEKQEADRASVRSHAIRLQSLFRNNATLLGFFLVIAAYVALIDVLGHFIATPAAIVAMMVLLGERRLPTLIATPVVTTVAIALVFRTLLSVILPRSAFLPF